jgi:RHS repeat-associated protein
MRAMRRACVRWSAELGDLWIVRSGPLRRRAACCALLIGFGLTSASAVAQTSTGKDSFESPAVREAIAHEILPEPGPSKVTQGGSGGTGEVTAPAGGELQPSLSTANSDTWRTPGQPLLSRIYPTPVNYLGSDNAWHPISDQLVATSLGGYENQANSFSLQLPSSLSNGVSLTSEGRSLTFALQDGRESLPVASGDTATYGEALASTDIEYVSTSSGVLELAKLKDASAPNEMRFALSTSAGLHAQRDADGTIELLDGQGKVWFRIPAPVAYRPGADPGTGKTLSSSLSETGSGWTLSVDTGAAWLREALASGAMLVDPTVEVSGTQACTLAQEAPSSSYCSSTSLQVGKEAGHQQHNALLEFGLSSIPVGANVLNAKLGLYVQSHSSSAAASVGVYRVTKPWTTAATWEKYNGTSAWSTPGGDYVTGEEASINPSIGSSTGWAYWYPTLMVQKWVNTTNAPEQEGKVEGVANEGLIVKDESSSVENLLSIASPSASADKPYLEVSYEPRGSSPEPQFTELPTQLDEQLSMSVNPASGNLTLQSQNLHVTGTNGEDYATTTTFNDLNPEVMDDGRWQDSNRYGLSEYGDGSFLLLDGAGNFFSFHKKADGTYTTPPGIKATLCTAGHAPCPTTLPAEVSTRLIYNQSQSYVDFHSWGQPVKIADRHNNALTAGYKEGVGTVASWTDTQSRKFEYSVLPSAHSFYTEIKDVTGERNVKYGYEGEGTSAQLTSYTNAAAGTTKYHYEYYDLTKVTTPKGNVTLLRYDTQHRLIDATRTTNAEHTSGPTTRFTYYKLGKAPTQCEAKQTGTIVTDPIGVDEEEEGKKAKRNSTKEEEKSEQKEPEAHQTLYCANVLGEVEKSFNANKAETKAGFDPFGNQIASTAAARETGGSQGVTSDVYGTAGQNLLCDVQGTTSSSPCPEKAMPHGYASEWQYKEPEGGFKYQPTTEISSRRKETAFCYWGAPTECGSGGGSGAAGELRQQTLPLSGGPSQKYEYNANGTVSSSTDADGHTTTYAYDAGNNNLKTVTPPSGSGLGKETITVDSLSRPHIIVQCLVESGGTCTSSQTATLTYDKLDRVTEAVDTGPGATKTFKYSYDADGNLEKRVDPTGTTKLTVDALNRVTEESLPGSVTLGYGYDDASNLTSYTDSGGTTDYFYNGLNEMFAMYEPGGNCGEKPSKCTSAKYDGAGSLEVLTYPSGATVDYGVDATTGRPTTITAKSPTKETLLSDTYTYEEGTEKDTPLIYEDVYSRPSTATNTTKYAYDALDRLEQAVTTGTDPSRYVYKLDAVGNRESQEVNPTGETGGEPTYYDYNSGNELECRMKVKAACSKSSSSEISGYSYDGAGNETAITGYSDPASTTFSYNNLNQLKDLTPPSSSEQALTYLGSGQSNLTGLGTSTLQNAAMGLTKQVNGEGTSYYARTASGDLIDERVPGGTSYNPVYDAQGDVIGLLSSSGGLAQTVRYGPYGENAQAEGSASDPFLFKGGYHLEGSNNGAGNIHNGLYHFGARYYEPTTGRWTQLDPQGAGYAYSGADPVNDGDPSGEGGPLCVRLGILSINCEGPGFHIKVGAGPGKPIALHGPGGLDDALKKCGEGALAGPIANAAQKAAEDEATLEESLSLKSAFYASGIGCVVNQVT